MKRQTLSFKRTAIGGKYHSDWAAYRNVKKDGEPVRVQAVIQRRADGRAVVFTWEIRADGQTIATGRETGSLATLAVTKESAEIVLTGWADA